MERWENYASAFCELEKSGLELFVADSGLEVLDKCLCFEAKRGFCSENRYYQAMQVGGRQTNSRWEHLCNKSLCFAENGDVFLFYSASERHVVKELVFLRIRELLVRRVGENQCYELSAKVEHNGTGIEFFFRHLGLANHLVPVDYARTSAIFRDYQKRFGRIELFAPFKWVCTTEHLAIHPVQIEEQSPKESLLAGERKMAGILERLANR